MVHFLGGQSCWRRHTTRTADGTGKKHGYQRPCLARLWRAADPEAADLAAGRDTFDLIDWVGCAGGPAQRLAVEAEREVADAMIGPIAGAVWAATDLDKEALGVVVGGMRRVQQIFSDFGRAR